MKHLFEVIQGQSTPLSLTAWICLQLCAFLPSPRIWTFSLMIDLFINCTDPDQSQRNGRASVLSRLLFPELITCLRSASQSCTAGKMDSEQSTELPLLTHSAVAPTLLNRNMYLWHAVKRVLIQGVKNKTVNNNINHRHSSFSYPCF